MINCPHRPPTSLAAMHIAAKANDLDPRRLPCLKSWTDLRFQMRHMSTLSARRVMVDNLIDEIAGRGSQKKGMPQWAAVTSTD